MPVKTFYPDGVTTMFDSDSAVGGVCLGAYDIPAGTSLSKSWPWLAGATARLTDVSGSDVELTGVPISVSNSPYPSVTVGVAPHDHTVLIWATGTPTIVDVPGMQAMSSTGTVALHPSGRGLNFIAKATYATMFPGYVGEAGNKSVGGWEVHAPAYFTSAIQPVALIDMSAGYYTGGVRFRWDGTRWTGIISAFSSLPTSANAATLTPRAPDIYLFGKPLSPGAGPQCAIYDDDSTLAFDLLAGPLLASLANLNYSSGTTSLTAPSATKLGLFGDPCTWSLEEFAGSPLKTYETGYWRLASGALTRHRGFSETTNDGDDAPGDNFTQTQLATSVEIVELNPY